QDGIDQPIEVIIDPDEKDLVDIRQKRLRHHWWAAQREREGLPMRADISASFLDDIADFTAVVSKNGNALRYESFGKGLARAYGRNMNGESVDALPTLIGQLFRSVYLLCEMKKAPVFTRHSASTEVTVDYWLRLVVPFGENSPLEVSHYIVCSIPVAKPEPASAKR
ncbi:MAG: hypothetical protein JNL04_23975, partial [Rhodospirillaceae bacterium]|nr:hypothetical protein [Rhodospirillaceae bacterium]